ncbi:MAG: TerC family protein [Candidatus Melainabacteria bacterium]|nr:TerC family protein [Candidatus Melainabacteria bacterium]
MESLFDPGVWAALLMLTTLEIVLGIDNIIFISILAGKVPLEKQPRTRTVGLAAAMVSRILLLFSLSWMMSLTLPILTLPVLAHSISGRDLILFLGGLFLIWKSIKEIHEFAGERGQSHKDSGSSRVTTVIAQIMMIDLVFSLDSVITAVGMVNNLPVMVAAIIISVSCMMFAAGSISAFVNRHPTMRMLALAFLLLIGVVLAADGVGLHISKSYVYFAMAFSFAVEMLNIRIQARKPISHATTQ